MSKPSIWALRQRLIELKAQREHISVLAESENRRDFTAAESKQFSDLSIAIAKNKLAQLEAEAIIQNETLSPGGFEVRGDGTSGAPTDAGRGPKPGTSTYRELFGLQTLSHQGFNSSGEFFNAVYRSREIADPRLLHGAGIQAAGAQREAQPSQGGFLVPSQFSARLLDLALESEIVRPRCQLWPMESPTLKVPGLDDFVHTGGVLLGGVVAAWANEMDNLNLQNVKTRLVELHANKLAILLNTSNELLEDAPDFSTMLDVKLRAAASFFLDAAFLFGTGVGQPRGVINDPALLTIAIEAGQTLANSGGLLYANITKMYARLAPQCRNAKSACWIVNSDLLPSLLSMQLVVKNVAGTENVGGSATMAVTYRADGSMMLLGMPLYCSEKLSAVGTVGDVILADFSQYAVGLRKEIEIRSAPLGPGFTNDSTWLRLITRIDGQGLWSKFLTPENGNTLSWCVTLAARA
jgi:HK97 family phage major capsid protein